MTLCTAVIGYAQTFVIDYITYTIISNQPPQAVKVTGYNTSGGSVVNIPTSVINNSITYNVTTIDEYAFQNKALTSVTIPNSVIIIIIIIGLAAFQTNTLSSVTIPDSVTNIGMLSFAQNQLTSIVLSINITDIPFVELTLQI